MTELKKYTITGRRVSTIVPRHTKMLFAHVVVRPLVRWLARSSAALADNSIHNVQWHRTAQLLNYFNVYTKRHWCDFLRTIFWCTSGKTIFILCGCRNGGTSKRLLRAVHFVHRPMCIRVASERERDERFALRHSFIAEWCIEYVCTILHTSTRNTLHLHFRSVAGHKTKACCESFAAHWEWASELESAANFRRNLNFMKCTIAYAKCPYCEQTVAAENWDIVIFVNATRALKQKI